MITLIAKINVLLGGTGSFDDVSINIPNNNISTDIRAIMGVKRKGSNPFLLGASTLDSGATYSDGESYYIGTQSAKEDGTFEIPYLISLSGSSLDEFTIAFDDYNNQYPTSIVVDGETYINNSPIFTVSVANISEHTIIIYNWNTPNYPLRIQGIYKGLEITVDKTNLIEIEQTLSDRSNFNTPSWGIISGTGRISFNDFSGEVLNYINDNLLKSGLDVSIYLKNTRAKNTEKVGFYQTETWNYNNMTKEVSISLKDDLEEWQDIYVGRINYNPMTSTAKNFKWLYDELYTQTPKKYNMLAFADLDEETKNVLENSYITYPMLESGTLWQEWDKLCQACQLHIYKDNNGNTVCHYNGGN